MQLLVFVELGKKVLSSVSQCVSFSVSILICFVGRTIRYKVLNEFIAIAGCVKKVSIEEGWEFFPLHTAKQHTSTGVSASRWDLTITPVGEKGWTTGKEN